MDTAYGTNAPEAVKLWSRKLAREALKKTYVKRFMGSSADSIVQIKNETQKNPGDSIRMTLRMQLTGDGTLGDANLEGNEESLTTWTDNVVINQLRHAVRSEGKMSEQRIPFSIRDEAQTGLADWWADRWDTWFFNQVCGYTPVTDLRYAGMNATLAPTRRVFAGGASNEQSLTTGMEFSLGLIDLAVENAKVGQTGVVPTIRPVKVDGKDYYVAFLHPYQVTDLRTQTSEDPSKPVLWYDIHKAALQGGSKASNPIFTGALGEYNGVVLHESNRITQGVHASSGAVQSNVRRAVLCGAQAAVCGFGEGHDKSTYDWFEQLFDYGNKLGVKAGCIAGLKKSRYNSIDFGAVVMSSYAAAHTALPAPT